MTQPLPVLERLTKYHEHSVPEQGRTAVEDTATLVRAAADGDAGAWREIYVRHSGLVWAVARAYLVNGSDAQDVCQTTWFKLAENLTRLREPDRVGAWLASTARHEALRTIRASGQS